MKISSVKITQPEVVFSGTYFHVQKFELTCPSCDVASIKNYSSIMRGFFCKRIVSVKACYTLGVVVRTSSTVFS